MENMHGFKYKRHGRTLNTSEFAYEDVVTPGAKKHTKKKRGSRKPSSSSSAAAPVAATISNPRHDPNAKTRPSKRRPTASPTANDTTDTISKLTKRGKQQQKQKKKKKQVSRRRTKPEEKLIAPMYPTDVLSGKVIRERVNVSTEQDKLIALFQEVLRAETNLVARNFKGKFQFVVNAIKGVSREFLQTLREEQEQQEHSAAATATQIGTTAVAAATIAKNPRNVALAEKKANLERIVAKLEKEEHGWVAAKERLQKQRQQLVAERAEERPITSGANSAAATALADVNDVQDIVAQSVQGISIELDALQRSLIASRHLADATLDAKDKLSEDFARYSHHQNGRVGTDTPRKLIKNLLRGPMPVATTA